MVGKKGPVERNDVKTEPRSVYLIHVSLSDPNDREDKLRKLLGVSLHVTCKVTGC